MGVSQDYMGLKTLSDYLSFDKDTRKITFVGKTMTVRVPRRFEVYGLQDISEYVQTLGIMALIIDDKFETSLCIPASIRMEPSEYSEEVIDGTPYLVMTFIHGDIFISNTDVVRSSDIIYAIWVEFFTRGRPLYTMGYDALAMVFDRAKEMTGSGIGVDRVLFELVIAHLARDAKSLVTPFRLTDMEGEMKLVPLRSVSYAPDSTTARLLGSYKEDGMVTSLNNENHESKPFENLLRGYPAEDVGAAENPGQAAPPDSQVTPVSVESLLDQGWV